MTDRIVGQGGQADDCVVAGAVPGLDIPHIGLGAKADVLRSRAEIATFVEVQVETLHGVPGGP